MITGEWRSVYLGEGDSIGYVCSCFIKYHEICIVDDDILKDADLLGGGGGVRGWGVEIVWSKEQKVEVLSLVVKWFLPINRVLFKEKNETDSNF